MPRPLLGAKDVCYTSYNIENKVKVAKIKSFLAR
jgi:hypothetical protein